MDLHRDIDRIYFSNPHFPFATPLQLEACIGSDLAVAILWVAWIVDQMGNWRRQIAWGLLVLSLMTGLITLLSVPKDDWRGTVDYVNTNALDHDITAIDPAFNRVATSYYDLALPIETDWSASMPEGSSGDIWFFAQRFPGQSVPSSPTERILDDNFKLVEAVPFYRLEVRRYRAKAQ